MQNYLKDAWKLEIIKLIFLQELSDFQASSASALNSITQYMNCVLGFMVQMFVCVWDISLVKEVILKFWIFLGSETHFKVVVVSSSFNDKPLIQVWSQYFSIFCKLKF